MYQKLTLPDKETMVNLSSFLLLHNNNKKIKANRKLFNGDVGLSSITTYPDYLLAP
jgi:hypothetical protein